MTKDELGFVGVDIGDGMPLPVREENPAGDDGMDVRMRVVVFGFIFSPFEVCAFH